MADEHRPFLDAPETPETSKKAQENRATVLAFHRVFATKDGKTVLDHLKRKFGFDRWEGDNDVASIEVIARRALSKGPIFEIMFMLKRPGSPPVKRKAKS